MQTENAPDPAGGASPRAAASRAAREGGAAGLPHNESFMMCRGIKGGAPGSFMLAPVVSADTREVPLGGSRSLLFVPAGDLVFLTLGEMHEAPDIQTVSGEFKEIERESVLAEVCDASGNIVPRDTFDDNAAKSLASFLVSSKVAGFSCWLCCCHVFLVKRRRILVGSALKNSGHCPMARGARPPRPRRPKAAEATTRELRAAR